MKKASDLAKEAETRFVSKHDSHLGATEPTERRTDSPEKRTASPPKKEREATLQGTPKVEIVDDSALIHPAGLYSDEEFIRRWLRQSDCIM